MKYDCYVSVAPASRALCHWSLDAIARELMTTWPAQSVVRDCSQKLNTCCCYSCCSNCYCCSKRPVAIMIELCGAASEAFYKRELNRHSRSTAFEFARVTPLLFLLLVVIFYCCCCLHYLFCKNVNICQYGVRSS